MEEAMKRFVAISHDGAVEVHAGCFSGNYDTICGIDGNDSEISHSPADLPDPRRPKITCHNCAALIREARFYRLSDISENV